MRWSLLAAVLALASPAWAEDLVAPVAVEAGKVPYPEGAHGDQTVVVALVVAQDGHVTEASIASGEEPFASAVRTAAMGWTFTPARRAGAAVVARIRMSVEFHAPVVKVEPPPAQPAPVKADAPVDVLVRGKRNEVGEVQMTAGEVRQLPGAFGDAFRAMEALPGVTPMVSGLPFFFVRGAPPGNTGYFLDGVRVPLLYHLALGPSVVHPGLIDRVDFYPGGYPARFGRYSGGILDGETLPPANKPHGEANIRIFDAGALAEAPFLDGRLTVLAAGRYSYTAALTELFAPNTRVAYWDYQTRVTYKLTPRDTISLFWFGSFDEVDQRDQRYTSNPPYTPYFSDFYPVFKTEFHRLDLRYDHRTAHGNIRVAATLGIEDSVAGTTNSNDSNGVSAKSLRLRTEGEERVSDPVKVRYGADVELYNYGLDLAGNHELGTQLYPNRNDVMIGVYTDAVWKASPRVEVVPGFRLDVFTSRLAAGQVHGAGGIGLDQATASVGADPRLATRVAINARATWLTTFGVSHQPPSFIVPVPGLSLGLLNTGLQTSLQASQGVEVRLPLDVTATASVFLHDYLGLTDATATCLSDTGNVQGPSSACLAERVRGRAYGLELLVKRDLTKRFTGWLSYTLSRSERETRGFTLPSSVFGPFAGLTVGAGEIPSEFDRTHVLNVVGAFDLGSGWRVGGRFVFYTGRPYSNGIQGIKVPPFNSERLPPFYRIDLRIEKRWRVFKRGWIALVIEGMNVTLTKEAVAISCKSDGSFAALRYDTCTPQYIGPISVPSIGVEGAL